MDELKLRQLFPQLLKENLMAFSNMTVPQHRHNGSDSPRIYMGDLLLDNRGLIFPFEAGNTIIGKTDVGTGIWPTDINNIFTIGGNTGGSYSPGFASVDIEGYDSVTIGASTSLFTSTVAPDIAAINTTSTFPDRTDNSLFYDDTLAGGTTVATLVTELDVFGLRFDLSGTNISFAVTLPDAPRPTASPGMIAFDSGHFYVCKTAGVWTLLS